MEKKTWFPEVKLVSRKTTSNSRDRWDSLKRGYAPQIPRLEPLRLSKWGTGSREITRKTVSKKDQKTTKRRKLRQNPSSRWSFSSCPQCLWGVDKTLRFSAKRWNRLNSLNFINQTGEGSSRYVYCLIVVLFVVSRSKSLTARMSGLSSCCWALMEPRPPVSGGRSEAFVGRQRLRSTRAVRSVFRWSFAKQKAKPPAR